MNEGKTITIIWSDKTVNRLEAVFNEIKEGNMKVFKDDKVLLIPVSSIRVAYQDIEDES